MDTSVKNKKLRTLPWYALHDIAVKKGIEEKEVNGKEKNTIIDKILTFAIIIFCKNKNTLLNGDNKFSRVFLQLLNK